MKLLHVTTILNTVNLFLIPHLESLMKQGHEVGIACHLEDDESNRIRELGCNLHHIPFSRNPIDRENLRAYSSIRNLVVDEGYELVHVHTPVASFVTRLACRNIPNIRMLYTAHGFHFYKGAPKKNNLVYYNLEKVAAKWTDALITMNIEDYLSAKRFQLRKKDSIFKVNGVGLDLAKYPRQTAESKMRIRAQYGFNEEDILLINVGELCYRKHQDLLIRAASKVKKHIQNVKVLIIGDGVLLENYKELALELGIENQIKFLGYRRDIPNLMTMADIAVSTSRQEGLPVNVMEAMATGLPLVVTNCRGNSDLVQDGVNGFVVGVHDVEECADAIVKICESKELSNRLSDNNIEMIKNYSTENVINEMSSIYMRI